ncbi:MAG: NOB1 family endonuclease, partial [Thermoplasmatota archaeon]
DTSAFLSGMINSIPSGYDKVLITSGVRDEVGKGAPMRNLENLVSAGLQIRDPITLERAQEAARSTGDIDRLSEVDISLIALAIEVAEATVVTDDFRVQNVLKSLGIGFLPAGEIGDRTISAAWSWTHRCKGCGRFFDEPQKKDECPVCGSLVRKYRRK